MLVFGEDVGPKGGVHGVTLGLQEKFGEARVFDTSLSEEGIIGRAVGMALAGLMPVPEIQFRKYADPAAEQLNDCGTLRWRTNNRFAAPMVVRMPVGFFKCGDPWHSQTNEVQFVHAPGWKVAVPSNAEDAVGLLRAALRGNDPVIFFEHRAMLDAPSARRPYPGDDFVLPFGRARARARGTRSHHRDLGRDGGALRGRRGDRIDVEIIDLRTLMPWDREAVDRFGETTRRCLIVHEDLLTAGFGAEIAAVVAESCFLDLDAPVSRLAMPDIPSPHNPGADGMGAAVSYAHPRQNRTADRILKMKIWHAEARRRGTTFPPPWSEATWGRGTATPAAAKRRAGAAVEGASGMTRFLPPSPRSRSARSAPPPCFARGRKRTARFFSAPPRLRVEFLPRPRAGCRDMSTDIIVPAEQEGTKAVLKTWLKKPGDAVRVDEPVCEIETDKVAVEIAASADGVLSEILVREGSDIEAGRVLGRIAEGSATTETESRDRGRPARSGPEARGPREAAAVPPGIRRLLAEHNLRAEEIPLRGDRLTREDIEAEIGRRAKKETPGSKCVPHDSMRRRIAEHMAHSLQTAPHVTALFEVDMGAVIAHREAHKPGFVRDGASLTFTAYFVAACVDAMKAVPQVNARWYDDSLEIFDDVNIGIGTALGDKGLIVPVIHRAQTLSLLEIARRLTELTEKARTGKLTPADVQNGTFSISNHGVSGSLLAAPIIINQPQSAILGIGKLQKRAVVRENDRIEARPMAYVTLTIDHRVLDAHQCNAWMTRFVQTLESWK